MRSPGVLVVAKSPVAGRVKTRLARLVGDTAAADLAAAAFLDTLDVCEARFGVGRRVVALDGELASAARGRELAGRLRHWRVIGQSGQGLGSRLAGAHRDAAMIIDGPVVQVGMDTPQLTSPALADLTRCLSIGDCDAVLALAEDGGWWALGLRDPRLARLLADVPMSTSDTGRCTRRSLRLAGARVAVGWWLRDVDDRADAEAVSASCAHSRFAEAWRAVSAPQQLDAVSA
ncbi:MAG: TIGR04282 family arsenosugar biosynthesis glycosyltransferase [Nocardioidaceae bacterium]